MIDTIFRAVETLGVPVAIAVFLIWHFMRLNKSLTDHNRDLIKEIGVLRDTVGTALKGMRDNDKLLRQNERLVDALGVSERASFELVRQLIELQTGNRAAKEENRNG